MPFKSEAQRKYLWANEPEIARDWTDTYGSGIQRALGGRIGYADGSDDEARAMEQAAEDVKRTMHSFTEKRGPLYIDEDYDLDVPLTEYEKELREMSEEEREEELKILQNTLTRRGNIGRDLGIPGGEKTGKERQMELLTWGTDKPSEETGYEGDYSMRHRAAEYLNRPYFDEHYETGEHYNKGGIIGSVGGTSRQKYQEGNMVGEEMEGAMMQSKEVIKELYDAFIAQGLSPQEAIEKIKKILAAAQAQESEAPMMGEEFPGQEFGGGPRAPAAFGGIMDTYTGRRKYRFGSFNPFKAGKKLVSKALKKVKQLASSKLGKLALMYAAGTYLGGMPMASGAQGAWWKSPDFLQNLKSGTGIRNLLTKGREGLTNVGDYFSQAFKPTLRLPKETIDMAELIKDTGPLTQREKWIAGATKALKGAQTPTSLLDKIPGGAMTAIGLPSVAAGLYTAAQPPETLGGEVQGEYDADLQKWKDYYAGLGADYSVDPSLLKSAQGGRVGRQEGGLMDLGGMEKDYREDGGFVPLGGEEKADDVPARLSRNEFVFTADAVKNAGGGDIDRGAQVMENVMKNLEAGGKVSEESQGQGAEEMFEVSERLSEVV